MGRFEYKEGILFVGGQVAADSTRAVIAALSACTGMDIKTTCDSLNQLLQSFDMLVDSSLSVKHAYFKSARECNRSPLRIAHLPLSVLCT